MSDSMVERVARALATRRLKRKLKPEFLAQMAAVEMLTCDNADIEDARAAIEAMLPPTEAMLREGWDVFPFAPGTETHAMAGGISPSGIWAVMITAALDTQAVGQVAEGRPEGPSVPE